MMISCRQKLLVDTYVGYIIHARLKCAFSEIVHIISATDVPRYIPTDSHLGAYILDTIYRLANLILESFGVHRKLAGLGDS